MPPNSVAFNPTTTHSAQQLLYTLNFQCFFYNLCVRLSFKSHFNNMLDESPGATGITQQCTPSLVDSTSHLGNQRMLLKLAEIGQEKLLQPTRLALTFKQRLREPLRRHPLPRRQIKTDKLQSNAFEGLILPSVCSLSSLLHSAFNSALQVTAARPELPFALTQKCVFFGKAMKRVNNACLDLFHVSQNGIEYLQAALRAQEPPSPL